MKEFKEDKKELEEKIKKLITLFNDKYFEYDVKVNGIDLEYIKFPSMSYDTQDGYLNVTLDIDV